MSTQRVEHRNRAGDSARTWALQNISQHAHEMLDKAVVSKTRSQLQEASVHVVSSKRKLFWKEGVLINDQDHVAKTARLVDVPPRFRRSHAPLQKRSSNITSDIRTLKKGFLRELCVLLCAPLIMASAIWPRMQNRMATVLTDSGWMSTREISRSSTFLVALHPRGRQMLSPRQDDEFALERFHPRLEFLGGDLGVGRDLMKCLVLENGPFSSELTSCLRGRLLLMRGRCMNIWESGSLAEYGWCLWAVRL
jgi:hypothetical protein